MNPKREHRVAYDFDHTITRSPGPLGCFASAPGTRSYIVTGRPISEKDYIVQWLEERGINSDIFDEIVCYPVEYSMSQFSSETIKAISIWKAETCRDMKIDILFEDNLLVIDPVKKISPNTLVSILI